MSELARYSRQIVLRELGVNGQQLLRDSTVLLIGLGGLGSIAAAYLAGAGIGRLLLSDRDRVDTSNLQRQVLYRQSDVGRLKSEAAAAQLRALNAGIEIEALDAQAGLAAVAQADVVLDCTDNFPARRAINAACVRARKPLVSGAAIRFEGQLALFDVAAGSACYDCLYPDTGEQAETCEEAGILGPVVGTVGALQALLALKYLLGLREDLNALQVWDARQMQWRRFTMSIDPACAVCGQTRLT
ncbi:sulfur carrier protein ThiS adenylyltransferase [Solimonas aquatica]|uniref:Sulfur carrier protein ThiS adenylyltransferase n=1 Tax=Solimonas aquatica TaxID=489703 RepID=A0A1H9DQ59_9GAMM|nr:HesA/MoeB/ThiF family protein [Solimonas aquatica]SEQ15660.1 sulfur carrier protein ThiS adenylyltransferase [Solimonas aquatica]